MMLQNILQINVSFKTIDIYGFDHATKQKICFGRLCHFLVLTHFDAIKGGV